MDYKAIADELKRTAEANPFEPFKQLGPPLRRHYRSFDDGLTVCFTLDILPDGSKFWHLSMGRTPQGISQAEQEMWCRLFFDEQPVIERPGEIPGLLTRHFFWRFEHI